MKIKIYKQLQIPENSAFDRTTIWKYLPIWAKEFFTGIKNIIKWAPTIWKDRDWDGGFIYKILQKKLEFQQKELVGANRSVDTWIANRDITICLNLVERIKDDFYGMEYLDYHKSSFKSIPLDGEYKGYSELKIDIVYEKFDDYISKNKLTQKKAIKYLEENSERYSSPSTDKKLQCMTISHLKQEKARRLLFKIMENKIESWWD
jgi:hypothetical protein